MLHRERFQRTMRYGEPDRVPYFEEGLREEVLQVWRSQGLAADADPSRLFPSDPCTEIEPDLEPHPALSCWPTNRKEVSDLQRRLDPEDPERLPSGWPDLVRSLRTEDTVRMLRVHRGFFLSMGVRDWERFTRVMVALIEDPGWVHDMMSLWGKFCAGVAESILKDVDCDAAIFSEPIGGNDGPLISPKMYEEFVLRSYEPVLEILHRHGVETIVLRTYANARLLVPSILKWGFNCLWACEVNIDAMDYWDLRREFGRDLRLIGGIDLDALRRGREAIRKEIEEKVPPLLADGGYVPLADGRVREDVRYSDYLYYRELLRQIIER